MSAEFVFQQRGARRRSDGVCTVCVCVTSRQALEKMTLQKQLQRLMDPNKAEGTPSRSPR